MLGCVHEMARRIRRYQGATSHGSSKEEARSTTAATVGIVVGVGTMPVGIKAG